MVFPVVMYRCESWTVKKAERQRTAAFKLWCRKRLLRAPWTARRSNQSILKEIKPVNTTGNQTWILIGRSDAEAEAPILWPPDVKSPLFGKDPDAGKDGGQEEKRTTEDEMVGWHHQLWTWVWASSGSWWWTAKPDVLHVVHGVAKSWTQLSNRTTAFQLSAGTTL